MTLVDPPPKFPLVVFFFTNVVPFRSQLSSPWTLVGFVGSSKWHDTNFESKLGARFLCVVFRPPWSPMDDSLFAFDFSFGAPFPSLIHATG